MHITMVLPVHVSASGILLAGAERNVCNLTKWLAERGIDVELLVLLSGADKLPGLVYEQLRPIQPKITILPKFHYKSLRALFRVFCLMRRRKHHLLHMHLMPAEIFCSICARLAGCKHIVTSWRNDDPFWARLRWRLLAKLANLITSHYISISHAVASYRMGISNIKKTKVTVIHHAIEAVPPSSFHGANPMFSMNYFEIGYVGRLTEQKGVDILLQAWSIVQDHCQDARLSIVGDGELADHLMNQATVSDLKRFRFLGPVRNAASMFWNFKVACIPSRWEGLGLVAFEAMQAGCPIVASNVGGIPEATGPEGSCALLIPPENYVMLANAIIRLYDDADLRKRLGSAGQKRLKSKFSVTTHVSKTLSVYRKVLHDQEFLDKPEAP